MTEHEHLQDLADEFNARARAEGRYLDNDFWEIPPRPGSILDIPETEKSKEDLAWFRERRRRREAASEETRQEVQKETTAKVQGNVPPGSLPTPVDAPTADAPRR
jgi:hypothetical protein